jgi:hypothetical protein
MNILIVVAPKNLNNSFSSSWWAIAHRVLFSVCVLSLELEAFKEERYSYPNIYKLRCILGLMLFYSEFKRLPVWSKSHGDKVERYFCEIDE